MPRARAAVWAAGLVATAALAVVRTRLARREIRRQRPAAPVDDVTVLVAVRSGDPLLPARLGEQARGLAPAQVLLLVDDDDPVGQDAARGAAAGRPGVRVVVCAPPEPGTNPKVHKLALAQADCRGVVVLLDDDTVLPPGALGRLVGGLEEADLATGIPVYLDGDGPWSRLLAGFVNSSALPTYLAQAALGPPVSVNGMVVAARRSDLERIGGLASLLDATCDDYALALAFRRHGLTIRQLAEPALLATTVADGAAYVRIMRRWLLFAQEVLRRDLSPRLVTLVLLPSVLPLAVTAAAVATGPLATAATVAVLAGQSHATRTLRREAGVPPERPGGLLVEVVALLLAPLHLLTAVLGPRHVRWRGRRVRVGVGDRAAGARA
ncbi:hypothetical protein C8046_02915 [Serinibacter arcticus]|uniref:Ceramide glucosyltransferase n=1 Tax=Serinibacter arcticus TaxID=1655435 RepID=A0A2U1ZS76_9MICO|nr:glycosyltransferase [Serinibacter arcticus]PWD49800.1 hypothetical protein C8046_02915 [Serinibacter arcticus]